MGRPRSARAHKQVLDAAVKLFAERGLDATSMDAIAEESGVSKATIYKHWPDKDALCLEAMQHLWGLDEEHPRYNSKDIRADLMALLGYRPAPERTKMQKRVWPHLMAYAARNPQFRDSWRTCVMDPTRKQLKQLIQRAIDSGELDPRTNRDVSVALLMGPMLYRNIFDESLYKALPEDMPQRVVDAFWKAHTAQSHRKRS